MLEYKKDGWKAALCLAPSLLLMCVFTFWPIINSFIMSFLNNYYFALNREDVYNTFMGVEKSYTYIMGGRFTGIGIQNFITLFRDKDFLMALKNTAFIVFISVPATVIIALLIAVGLNSIKALGDSSKQSFFSPMSRTRLPWDWFSTRCSTSTTVWSTNSSIWSEPLGSTAERPGEERCSYCSSIRFGTDWHSRS